MLRLLPYLRNRALKNLKINLSLRYMLILGMGILFFVLDALRSGPFGDVFQDYLYRIEKFVKNRVGIDLI